ncbi:MAG: LysR family transcriptional regulator [Clostridia bacterium]|nr:LysR family transcriptional regulator [Clostridia bacterium]
MVDLELYKIFKIVAEEENITNASKRLNISQPAVTKHIKNLEEALKVKLFERTNKGLKLTEVGKNIFEEITSPITILENIYKKYGGNKDIELGIHATMLNKLFSKPLSKYYETNESVKINITNNNSEEMLSKLEKQELDIVISKKVNSYTNKKIEFIKLGKMQDILVVNNTSDLLNKEIDENELKEKIFYMPRKTSITTINFFDSIGSNESEFSNVKNISYNAMLEIIKNTNGIGLVTKEYTEKELREKEISELKTTFKIKPIEFGIYINKENKFKELAILIKLIENEMPI